MKKKSVDDFKETFDNYSKKLLDVIQDCSYLSPENQVRASELVKAFLDEFGGLSEEVAEADDFFIEKLRSLPRGSIGAHYAELWDSINSLQAQNIPRDELLMFLDSAIVNFTREFTITANRDIFTSSEPKPELRCIFSACTSTYNTALAKIGEVLPTEDIAGERK